MPILRNRQRPQGAHFQRWTRFGRVVILIVPGIATFATLPVAAQGRSRPAEFIVAGGVSRFLPEAFQPCGGRNGAGLSARLGLRFHSALVFSATLDLVTGPRNEGCGIPLPPPSPGATGHFEAASYDGRLIGYPVYQTGLRLGFRPFRSRRDEPEIAVALERAWRQHLWVPVVSLSDLAGGGPIKLLLEGSVAWYRIPFTVQSYDLDHGVLLQTKTEKRAVTSASVRLRFGVAIPFH